jgi:putative transcriptional regulator
MIHTNEYQRRPLLIAHADIPRLIRNLREQTGLTQEKFATKLGVTLLTINRWENGRAKPSATGYAKG